MGSGTAAGTIGAGAGSIRLTIGARGSGLGGSTLATSRTGGGAGTRGATRGADGNVTGCLAGNMNTMRDRVGGGDDSSDARIGSTISTTTTMACNPTLSHRPGVQRPRGRVLNRESANRIDMSRTQLQCRSVQLPWQRLVEKFLEQAKCRREHSWLGYFTGEIGVEKDLGRET
jgi:hypothetical protein